MTDYLKEAIVEYLIRRPNKRSNSIDIVDYFNKLPVDKTYTAIVQLEKEGRIIRYDGALGGWNGNHHYEVSE